MVWNDHGIHMDWSIWIPCIPGGSMIRMVWNDGFHMLFHGLHGFHMEWWINYDKNGMECWIPWTPLLVKI